MKSELIRLFKYIKKHVTKKELIIAGTGLGFLVIGFISWNVYFSKYYILAKEEKQFLEAVKGFYKYHPEYLPKNGSVKTKTLAEVYEEGRLEELKVPKGKDICDLDSWVKVYNDNGKYIYHTYLKCGKYASKTDHEGPKVTLNGDSTIYIHLGDEYQELGVKEVKDNKDGKMGVDTVIIDSSKVNTKKIGEYVVTYKVKDKIHNTTTVERTVKVVRKLTRLVQDDTKDTNGYYQGTSVNNYVLFSGMVWRIVKVNDDGTLMLINNDNISNLRYNSTEYEKSNIDKYLNDVFMKAIHDDSYIVEKEYCVGNINDFTDIEGSCSKKITSKVALLSLDEFKKTFTKDNKSYMCGSTEMALSNRSNGSMIFTSITKDNCAYLDDTEALPAIKPVITIKADLATTGAGTLTNPYKLADYEYGKVGSKINTRLVGEYVNYSGLNYRIQKIEDGNVTLIAADPLAKKISNGANTEVLKITVPEQNYIFNTTDSDNPGYIINNQYIDYINDSNIITTTYVIPTYDSSKNYNEYETKEIKTKIVIPKTYDLFSGVQSNDDGYIYLYLDNIKDKTFYINRVKNVVYVSKPNEFFSYCIKPVITVKGDMVIKDGKGTSINPYYIGNR